jgi:hypothetical protein
MQGAGTLVSFDLTTMTIRWKSKVGSTPAGVLWHNGKVLVRHGQRPRGGGRPGYR